MLEASKYAGTRESIHSQDSLVESFVLKAFFGYWYPAIFCSLKLLCPVLIHAAKASIGASFF
jgi:hypothetical protein